MSDYSALSRTLNEHNQGHLLKFYDELSQQQAKVLTDQLEAIDFTRIDELIEKYVRDYKTEPVSGEILPAEIFPAKPADDSQKKLYEKAEAIGLDLLKEGKVAAFVVAGGQGSRLGYEGPKGCFEATPIARKPLFQIFAEQILAAAKRAGANIPWYIMTSPINDSVTRVFFRQNNFFGMNPEDVFFFQQGTLPSISRDGKLLLQSKESLALNPDGHGGSLLAMQKSGALADMSSRGVEIISYFQVDNPLVRCIDPLFIGLHKMNDAQMSAKSLAKRDPLEKVGNFCTVNGRTTVIEYSDMPEELAYKTNEDGRLKFSAGSIAIHILSREFVEKLTTDGKCRLPLHRADKKVPYLDDNGNLVKPDKPNAVKLEMFVFDAMPLAEKTVILETLRDQEFSPIKNAEGEDSPASSLHDQVRRAAGWLEKAGVIVPRDAMGEVAAALEISPLFADSEKELAAKIDTSIQITSGQQFYLGSRGQIGGTK